MLPSECLVSQSNVSEDSTCDASLRGTTTIRRLSRDPEHVGRHSFAEYGLLFQRLIACSVGRATPLQAHAQLSNMEFSSTTLPAAYRTTTAGTRLHRLVYNSSLSRHSDGRHRRSVLEVDLVAI